MPAPYEYVALLRPATTFTTPKGALYYRDSHDKKQYPHGVVAYEKPLRKADIEHFDLWPLDPRDPLNIHKVMEAWRNHVYEVFSEKDIFVVELPGGRRQSLTYSTRQGVEFQLTFWDGDEPTGHLDLNDFDEAVRELRRPPDFIKWVTPVA